MKSTTEAKQKLEAGMREALRGDQLFLMYQPRVDLRSGQVCGFEALLRWQHPEQGLLLPPAFLSEAEENGCIVQIGNLVLDQACAFLDHLRQGGFNDLSMSVNISHREFSQHDFVAGIAARLERHALPADRLEIELRGDDLIRDMGLGRDVANQMHALGLPLSVDDFGDGLSHLQYLQQLAASRIKIAMATVHAIGKSDAGSAIAKTVIDIGHNLNMSVIAEAVETHGQLDFLRAQGCDQIQGSCFSGPLRAEAAEQLVRERHLA
jgi:EAL domain-containing protein (putative c-di-GMP-specific phosphodiesterase class I)